MQFALRSTLTLIIILIRMMMVIVVARSSAKAGIEKRLRSSAGQNGRRCEVLEENSRRPQLR
jgi:hypothetical protein